MEEITAVWREDSVRKDGFDVIIFGSGPAELQAAIHAARRKVSVLVLGRLPWQVAKAVGDGCIARLEAAAYAKILTTGIH